MSEWQFKRDTAFRKQFFVPESFSHPAKMDSQLLIKIVETYTKEGETILDPMAGSGTMMLACGLGRNVVLVELEDKFCKMMRDNWEEVRMRPQLGYAMGDCQIMQGDARNLSGVVDRIITSPPFAGNKGGLRSAENFQYGDDAVGKRMMGGIKGGTGTHPDNIDNLPYGEVDKCIFSPPYAESVHKGSGEWSQSPDGKMVGIPQGEDYTKSKDNIANLPYGSIDKIVTSPPYEGQLSTEENYEARVTRTRGKYKDCGVIKSKVETNYSPSDDNIGNLKSDSYLEAMLQVYQQCHSVLKPQGLMILVTKNFIRNKQVVRLDTDTIKLCEQAGFIYLERHYRKLPSQSFWRVIYHQKHPDVEQINYEDVLAFKKMELKV